jgi:ubiquitin C-terminal hydrolase
LKGIGKKNAKKVLKALKKPVERRCAFKGRIVVRFSPRMKGMHGIMLSNGLPVSQTVWDFLNRRHEAYKMVCKEEGYNRQYLGKKGYIVCDQVYAGKKEKVELFDVLYHDEKTGKLYLYHIKEKFGQPTREACAQIRVAAQTLSRDRAEEYPHLKSLHEKAMNSKGTSSFQKSVKEQFNALCPEFPGSNEGLIKLFDKDPQDIVFVYAFIDTGSPERRLEQELDPIHVFNQEDFPSENCDVCGALKQSGYLSKSCKLTRKAIKATKEKFKGDFEDKLSDYNAVFRQLKKYTSQFDSMGAKLELLHLRDHIRTQFSFGFQICQIDRSGFFSESSEEIDPLEADVEDGVGEPDEVHFRYGGQEYQVENTPSSYREEVWHVLGYSTNTHTYLKKLHFAQTLVHITGNAEEKLDALLEERFPNIMTTEDRVQTYIDQVVWKSLFFEEDLEIAAWVVERRCLIFEQSSNNEQDLEIDTEAPKFDFNGESLAIVCIVKSTDGRAFLCHTKDEQACRLIFPIHWGSIDLPIIPTGIKNSGTDCFVNAALQLIMYTSLIDLFKDERLLLLDDDPGNYDFDLDSEGRAEKVANEKEKRRVMFRCLREFLVEYALSSKENLKCSSPSQLRKAISELNGMHPDTLKVGQQDAAELFGLLRGCYDATGYLSVLSKEMIPNRDEEEDITQSLVSNQNALTQYSMVDDSGRCEIEKDRPFCLELPLLPTEHLTFQNCFDAYLNETNTTEWKYSYGSQVFKSQASTQMTVLSKPHKGLLVSYKRFTSDGGKIHSKVILDDFTLDFDSTFFKLKGFIVHKGDLRSGHYVTYCFYSDTGEWYLFDDEIVAVQKENKVKEAVQGAYILFFEPTDPPRQLPTIRINLNIDLGGRQLASQQPNDHRLKLDRAEACVGEKKSHSEGEKTSQSASHKKARIEKEKKVRPVNRKRARSEEEALSGAIKK